MKLLIAIPSKNRLQILMENALKWVPLTGIDYMVFVEPQDGESYSKVVDGMHLYNLGENNLGLGFAKRAIKEYAMKYGYTHVFKLDDDVKCFTDFRQKLPPEVTATKVTEIVENIRSAMEQYPNIKAVAFPYAFEMYERKMWEPTKRIQTAYIVEVESMHADPRISVFEDFAAGLSIIVKGGAVLKYGLSGIDMGVKVGGGTGGHQSFDRTKQAMSELDLLREIYPPLNFRKVDKPWGLEPDLSSVIPPARKP